MGAATPQSELLLLTDIVASSADDGMADRLHDLAHDGGLEILTIQEGDARRHRLRVTTDKGTECAIALPRDRHLSDGDLLLLEPARAIVVRLGEVAWLRLLPRDAAVALRLGYHAGNLHWRVRFEGDALLVALDGERQAYLDRLEEFLSQSEIEVCR